MDRKLMWNKNKIHITLTHFSVCVCVCVHVYVVYEDTNLYNDIGITRRR